ncbi:hypothetical protein BVRB_6g148470 [Beta vulgaris subsp. vulgaris]|nr:hypothetical protein BVRB_6g148470 [Beta vulgaris subsp. vulgaris]
MKIFLPNFKYNQIYQFHCQVYVGTDGLVIIICVAKFLKEFLEELVRKLSHVP